MKNLMYLMLVLFVSSCSPKLGADWVSDKYIDRSYNKLAVIGISNNLEARTEFERTAVELLRKEGLNAIEGIKVFPASMSEKELEKENLIKLIKEHDLDGVLTMSLIDSEEFQKYEPGDDQVVNLGYYRIGKYLVRRYATIRTPGYYVPSKTYLIEAVLYDVKGKIDIEENPMVWKGQSTIVDPSSIQSAARSFSNRMVKHIVKQQVITK